jgi:hypothetical protein
MVPIRSAFRSRDEVNRRTRRPSGSAPSLAERLAEALGRESSIDGAVAGAIATALTATGAKAARRLVSSRQPSYRRLFRGAAAGAGAAGILFVVRRFLDGVDDIDLLDELLAGMGKGMVYTAILDPFLPGPPAVRGATVGVVEYMLQPWGGLLSQLQGLSPARRLPLVGALVETGDAEEDPFISYLIYGLALGLLCGEGEPGD